MAGVNADTTSSDVLDVLSVLMWEVPREQIVKHRRRLDVALAAAQVRTGAFDRATWGLSPDQIEQQRRAMQQLGQGG